MATMTNTFPDETVVDGWLVNTHTGNSHHLWILIDGPNGRWNAWLDHPPHGQWHLLRHQWGTYTIDHHFPHPVRTWPGAALEIRGHLHTTNDTPDNHTD